MTTEQKERVCHHCGKRNYAVYLDHQSYGLCGDCVIAVGPGLHGTDSKKATKGKKKL